MRGMLLIRQWHSPHVSLITVRKLSITRGHQTLQLNQPSPCVKYDQIHLSKVMQCSEETCKVHWVSDYSQKWRSLSLRNEASVRADETSKQFSAFPKITTTYSSFWRLNHGMLVSGYKKTKTQTTYFLLNGFFKPTFQGSLKSHFLVFICKRFYSTCCVPTRPLPIGDQQLGTVRITVFTTEIN
jgi:hypothetical protein